MGVLNWNKKSSLLIKENQVALVNNEAFLKVNMEYYKIIDAIIKNEIEQETLKDCFVDLNDYKKIMEIINKLLQINVLVSEDVLYSEANVNKINSLTLLITNKCNLSCIHCSQNTEQMSSLKREMSFGEICILIDALSEYSINSITVSGGEPLIREDFLDIVRYLRQRYKGKLILMTNGLLITDTNIKEIVNSFDLVSISMDGCDEELTTKIRGKGIYSKVIEKIKLLHMYNYFNIELSAILPSSIEIEKKFEDLCLDLNVKPILRSLIYKGRAFKNSSHLKKVYKEYLVKQNYSSYNSVSHLSLGSLTKCDACEGTITVDAYGDLYPCNLLQNDKYKIGSVLNDKTLFMNFRSSEVSSEIEAMKDVELQPCVDCEIKNLCWFCLADFVEFISYKSLYKNYCDIRKNTIYKYFFDEEMKNGCNNLDNNCM